MSLKLLGTFVKDAQGCSGASSNKESATHTHKEKSSTAIQNGYYNHQALATKSIESKEQDLAFLNKNCAAVEPPQLPCFMYRELSVIIKLKA